jgi:DNA-directed RNA polymerase alpha subunit
MQLHPFIEGVDHESTISGVVEDVTEIIHLKQVRFKRQIEDIDKAVTICFW